VGDYMEEISNNERNARMNCGKLLSNLGDNTYDCVNVWSDSSRGYLVVNSIDEYENKKENMKKHINKLALASIASLLIAITSNLLPNQVISEPIKTIVGTVLIIAGITLGVLAIKESIEKAKIKKYLESAKEYLRDFKPKLFETLEDKKKIKNK